MRRAALLAWVGLLAVLSFGAGLSTGVLVARRSSAPSDRAYADELRRSLDLSDSQYEQVQRVVASYSNDLERIYDGHLEKLKDETGPLKQKVDEKIKQILEPEQRARFEGLPASSAEKGH